MNIIRFYKKYIINDLKKKMVFIGGPRQVGKTTLTKDIAKNDYQDAVSFNWDKHSDQTRIIEQLWPEKAPLVVFDELHKYPHWKQWIKGLYDTKPEEQQYLVTGSARLDMYKRGGDSLLGRYHYWRMHPFTLDELPPDISLPDAYKRLITVGGFPEPFLANNEREARRWRLERFNRVFLEDIRDLTRVRELQLLRLMIDALRKRVGGLISCSSLAEDLQVSPSTIKTWISLCEQMYICFAVYPENKNIPRAIHKPFKVYFYDNADCIGDESVRLENLVATHLLKRLHFIEDYEGYRVDLRFIRDKDGREVDFVTSIDDKIVDIIEVKLSDSKISSSLNYYHNKLAPKNSVQIVANLSQPYDKNGIHVTNPIEFFKDPIW